jgi:hypothetical protein
MYMKKYVILFLLAVSSFPLFAQVRNGQNLTLLSWTINGEENGMVEKVSSAVVQTNKNDLKYTIRTSDAGTIIIEFNRVTKILHLLTDPDQFYSTSGSFGESGSNSQFTFTDSSGDVNVLKFRRK